MAKRKIRGIPVLRFFLTSATPAALVGKCVLLLVIPYAYLLLCGLIFDKLLRWYFMTTFIFFSLIALAVLALIMIVAAIVIYVKGGRPAPRHKGGTRAKAAAKAAPMPTPASAADEEE